MKEAMPFPQQAQARGILRIKSNINFPQTIWIVRTTKHVETLHSMENHCMYPNVFLAL